MGPLISWIIVIGLGITVWSAMRALYIDSLRSEEKSPRVSK
jgi:hypothetical protein